MRANAQVSCTLIGQMLVSVQPIYEFMIATTTLDSSIIQEKSSDECG